MDDVFDGKFLLFRALTNGKCVKVVTSASFVVMQELLKEPQRTGVFGCRCCVLVLNFVRRGTVCSQSLTACVPGSPPHPTPKCPSLDIRRGF